MDAIRGKGHGKVQQIGSNRETAAYIVRYSTVFIRYVHKYAVAARFRWGERKVVLQSRTTSVDRGVTVTIDCVVVGERVQAACRIATVDHNRNGLIGKPWRRDGGDRNSWVLVGNDDCRLVFCKTIIFVEYATIYRITTIVRIRKVGARRLQSSCITRCQSGG